jgi:predicted nucleic acid-binding protein
MAVNLCLDTCFLIDIQRERMRGRGPATEFLRLRADFQYFVSAVTWGEFADVRNDQDGKILKDIRQTVDILPVTERVAEQYSKLVGELRAAGNLIKTNDLWIAATALNANIPLVTRNFRDFQRISQLQVLNY